MDKISASQLASYLQETTSALRTVTQERDEYASKLASLQQEASVNKVASMMVEKGTLGMGYDQAREYTQKMAEAGRLDVLEEALALQGADMGSKIASLAEAPVASGSSAAENDFIAFLMGN